MHLLHPFNQTCSAISPCYLWLKCQSEGHEPFETPQSCELPVHCIATVLNSFGIWTDHIGLAAHKSFSWMTQRV